MPSYVPPYLPASTCPLPSFSDVATSHADRLQQFTHSQVPLCVADQFRGPLGLHAQPLSCAPPSGQRAAPRLVFFLLPSGQPSGAVRMMAT